MASPDFICMGFQKCGTTSLFEILNQHPGVALCRDVKEPMYFRVPIVSSIGRKKYYEWRYFGHIADNDPRLVGEINAGLTFTNCAQKVSRNVDHNVKMVFMMRDPVERSYSAYKYFLARGFLPDGAVESDAQLGHAASFDAYAHSVLDDKTQRDRIMGKRLKYLVLSQSNYTTCIREYLDIGFKFQNMKFVLFEEFVADQHAACLDIYDFLGLTDSEAVDYSVCANEGKERAVSSKSAEEVKVVKGWRYGFYEFVCMPYWAPKLYGRYNDFYHRVRKKSIVADTTNGQSVLPETRAYLLDYFSNEIDGVAELTGRDDIRDIWNCR